MNISYIINGILTIAVIILFILFFNSNKQGDQTVKPLALDSTASTSSLPIAYVNVDSLLSNYQYAKISGERLMGKFKSSNNTVAQKQKQIQNEVNEFDRKLRINAFLTPERAQEEQTRIQKMGADLQQMTQRLENELAREEMNINEQMADSVRTCIEIYNRKANYQIIFSNKGMDNILIADRSYDVTQEVLDLLNSRYKASQK